MPPIGRSHTRLVAPPAVQGHQCRKSITMALTGQQLLDQRNIDSQPVSDARWANSVGMKLCHELNLTHFRQIAEAGITQRWARRARIDMTHTVSDTKLKAALATEQGIGLGFAVKSTVYGEVGLPLKGRITDNNGLQNNRKC